MTSGTVVVAKLGTTQLSGAPLADSSVIYNQSTTSAVWLASTNSVSPGNGIRLKPLSNVTWANKLAYACVDTGVNAPVSLTISDDATSYTDPTAEIANAIVASISGTISAAIVSSIDLDIANILSTVDTNILNALLDVQGQSKIDLLLNSQVIASAGFSSNIDISKYSEIIILPQTASPFLYFLQEATTGFTIDSDYIPARNSLEGARLAAIGDQLVFQNLDAGVGTFSVFGTNRVPLARKSQAMNTGIVREWFSASVNRTAGNDYNLTLQSPGFSGESSGQMFVSVEVGNSPNVQGYFWVKDPIMNLNLRIMDGDHAGDSDAITRSYGMIGWPGYATQVGFHCTKGAPAAAFLRLQAASANP